MGRVFPCIVCTFENMPSIISNFNLFFLNSFLELAVQYGQDLKKREFKDQSWLGLKTRSRDPTLSRHKGININELYLHTRWFPHIEVTIKKARHYSIFSFDVRIASSPTGETWRGKWQGNEIAAKILTIRECTPRISRGFNEEYPKLR